MKIVAPIPVYGRLPLVKLTVTRLQSFGVIPIMIGHEPEAKQLAIELGCEWLSSSNDPLGNKWNAGFQAAKCYDPDAVIFMGSSDWCSSKYIETAKEYLNDYGMLGMLGCHFADVADEIRLVNWRGYGTGPRHNEPIGIGRVLNRELLQKINYTPFDSRLSSGLDWSMWLKAIAAKVEIGIIPPEDIQLLSISTNRWNNKHKFLDHWSGKLPSERLDPKLLDINFSDIHKL
jgi:hypothetical protein